MKKVRIIERTNVDGRVSFVIQQPHFLFRWWWVDAWMNRDISMIAEFNTFEEAKRNLCYFDGSKSTYKVVF